MHENKLYKTIIGLLAGFIIGILITYNWVDIKMDLRNLF